LRRDALIYICKILEGVLGLRLESGRSGRENGGCLGELGVKEKSLLKKSRKNKCQ